MIFLMTDSMDGRVLDPTSNIYSLMEMPNLRGLAAKGTNMIRTYTNSPQCVPGRAALISGLRTDQSKTFTNNIAFAASSNGTLDPSCMLYYNTSTCQYWKELQNLNLTFVDALLDMGYNIYINGKMDTGAFIIEQPQYKNGSMDGWHNGPKTNEAFQTMTRSANIFRVSRAGPMNMTNDTAVDAQKYSSDQHVCYIYLYIHADIATNLQLFHVYG